MRKAFLIFLPLFLLVLAAASGWYWWTEWRFLQATDDAYVQSDISLISPKVEGYIKEVRVQENQPVRLKPHDRLARQGPFLARLLYVGPIMLAGPQSFF